MGAFGELVDHLLIERPECRQVSDSTPKQELKVRCDDAI